MRSCRLLLALTISLLSAAFAFGCGGGGSDGDGDADGDVDGDSDGDVDGDADGDGDGDRPLRYAREYIGWSWASDGDVLALSRAYEYREECAEDAHNHRYEVVRADFDDRVEVLFELTEPLGGWLDWMFLAAASATAFALAGDAGYTHIYDQTGSVIRTLEADLDHGGVALSADGGHAAYSTSEGIFLVELPAGEPELLRAGAVRYLAFSQDGTRLAFDADGMRAINVDGTEEIRVSPSTLGDTQGPLTWADDGSRIYFLAEGERYSYSVNSVEAVESGAVTRIGDVFWWGPVSPNGRLILYGDLNSIVVYDLVDEADLTWISGSYICG